MDAEQVQALMARQEELHTRLQATEATVQAANHRAELAERQLADLRRNPDTTVVGAAGAGPKANSLVDTRSLGRPKVFSGKREEWKRMVFFLHRLPRWRRPKHSAGTGMGTAAARRNPRPTPDGRHRTYPACTLLSTTLLGTLLAGGRQQRGHDEADEHNRP